jgi:hypothetical protein
MSLFRNSNKMRVYSVHLNPRGKKIYENAMFISENFNIFAFLFTGIWALTNRLWLAGVIILVVQYGILIVAKYFGVSIIGGVIIDLGIRFLLGLCGNDLWRTNLAIKGYVLSDVIVANNYLEATHRYYGRHIKDVELKSFGVKLV